MTEKSTASLERDAERVRADIADTADHLKEKMSPGQLMDEVVDYFKDGDTNQLLANLKHQVRDNPLALALVGSGLAWLMMGSGPEQRHSGKRSSTRPQTRPAASSMAAGGAAMHQMDRASGKPATSGHGSGIGKTAAQAKDAAAFAADRVGVAASSASATAGDAIENAADAVHRSLHDFGEGVSEQIAHATNSGSDMAERAKASFLETLEREPLVIGALGLAVGAAIGSMVPVTRPEQETIGEASHKLRDEVSSAISSGVDKARDVAGEAYDAAREEADRQGLTGGSKPVAAKIADVASVAGVKAKKGTRRAVDEAERTMDRGTDDLRPRPNRN